MSLPSIEPYVETFFWATTAWQKVPDGWFRRDVYTKLLSSQILSSLERFGGKVAGPYPELVENIFDRLVDKKAIKIEQNSVSGNYFRINNEMLSQFQQKFLANSEIYRQVQTVGANIFDDVFLVYGEGGIDIPDSFTDAGLAIPASDRIVKLNDNQINEINDPLIAIIDEVEKSNGDPDYPGFRERILGQLRSGKELISAGTLKSYLLYSVLLTALGELARRHKGTVIEATIQALVALLAQHVFTGA